MDLSTHMYQCQALDVDCMLHISRTKNLCMKLWVDYYTIASNPCFGPRFCLTAWRKTRSLSQTWLWDEISDRCLGFAFFFFAKLQDKISDGKIHKCSFKQLSISGYIIYVLHLGTASPLVVCCLLACSWNKSWWCLSYSSEIQKSVCQISYITTILQRWICCETWPPK